MDEDEETAMRKCAILLVDIIIQQLPYNPHRLTVIPGSFYISTLDGKSQYYAKISGYVCANFALPW